MACTKIQMSITMTKNRSSKHYLPVFNNGLKPTCLAERTLSHLLNRVAEPTGLTLYDPGGGALKAPSHTFNFGAALLCVGDFSQKIV